MEPKYFTENKFTYKRWIRPDPSRYVAEEREIQFEKDIADLISGGHQSFGREEYRLALLQELEKP